MTDQAQLQQALAGLLAQAQNPPPPAQTGWAQTAGPSPQALITGVAVPIKIDTPMGSVRAYLSLPPEIGQNPQALLGAIQALANAGYPIDAYQPKQQWGQGGNSGGWSGGGNGYNGGNRFGGRRW